MKTTPLDTLRKYWHYRDFRPLQAEIIGQILAGKDLVALLPTGAGKSLCFQVPAIMQDGLTLVVSPLIALMNDQVKQLVDRGVRAAAIHSHMARRDVESTLNLAFHQKLDLLYVSPERLVTSQFKLQLEGLNLATIVIDEAHCTSLWGYDFRPSYLLISEIRAHFPKTNMVAFTATATREVLADIQDKLALRDARVFRSDFLRPNLRFGVFCVEDKMERIDRLLKQVKGAAVIYCTSRKSTQTITRYFERQGVSAIAYHAGLDHEVRDRAEKEFMSGATRVIVATNAFGMGIDKSNVRLVVHHGIPTNLESYYQEAGRAGRDGKASYAIALFQEADIKILHEKMRQEFPEMKFIRRVYQALGNYFKLANGAGQGRSFSYDHDEFCDRFRLPPQQTRATLKILEQSGWLVLNEGFHQFARVKFSLPAGALYEFRVANQEFDKLIDVLLRGSEGIMYNYVNINEHKIMRRLGGSVATVKKRLNSLTKKGVLKYIEGTDLPQLVFLQEKVAEGNLTIDRERYDFLKERRGIALQAIESYLRADTCRQRNVLHYFNETLEADCGVCDNCRKNAVNNSQSQEKYVQTILQFMRLGDLTLSNLLDNYEVVEHPQVISVVQYLLGEEIIEKKENILRVV